MIKAKYEPTDTITWSDDSVTISQATAAALIEFASTDEMRPHLGVGISDGQLCATDGHSLLRFDAPECEPVKALLIHGKAWSREYVVAMLAIARATKADVKLEFSAHQDAKFPPVGQVVPEPGFGVTVKGAPSDKGIRKMTPVGVNPMYLARMCKVTKACGVNGVQITAMRGELDPVMFQCEGKGKEALKATVVIMPMRI